MNGPAGPLAEVVGLTVDFWTGRGWANVVNRVTFEIRPGESLGLAGESGCGKSTTAYALFAYRRPGSRFRAGQVRFEGRDLLHLDEPELRRIRGARIALVPQNPATALTPSIRVGGQIAEVLTAHGVCRTGRELKDRTVELLADVGLPQPASMAVRYPHELSGGQQQRVAIAIALACRPRLLVLDEPTTALDVTTQARILRLLLRLREEHGMSMLYVSHNLGVLAQVCDRIAVMYAGELVEIAPAAVLFEAPRHPYTRGLIASVPRLARPPDRRAALRGLLRRDELGVGCRFASRCPYALSDCWTTAQELDAVADRHAAACWRWPDIERLERVMAADESARPEPARAGTIGAP